MKQPVSASRRPPKDKGDMNTSIPENLYRGEVVSYPGPWSFLLEKQSIILVSDQDLLDLSDPDKVVDLSLTYEPRRESLRQVCERARAQGQRTLILAYDHFFGQYRPGQHEPRRLMPDMPEYVERVAAIARFAVGYGLGLDLSLLNPLEIGPSYRAATGESGLWMHARKGLRDPVSGAFSVQLWQHKRWVNNKGVIALEDAGVRVFAFRETAIPGTTYRAVDPASIREVTECATVERWDGLAATSGGATGGSYRAERVRVHGAGRADAGPLDRVVVVQMYRTPEMDYFSPRALPFLTGLLDRYVDAGVALHGLYSDEMHIQGDWGYATHHDNGSFALRYVSDGLADRFARAYGEKYRDVARYMLYFVHGQEDASNTLDARTDATHVFGSLPEEIARTALFRARYYRLLQDGVVDLFVATKRHLEARQGYRVDTRAHATWAESPTIDVWQHAQENPFRQQYEYTSNFLWSNTVHQAASACHDYFKWGEYLTGTGNDHAECGWLDRDYLGLALACSTGIVNEVPYSYAFHWGMPAEIGRRRTDLMNAYGTAGSPCFGLVQDMQHRDVEVLMLYPLDLVAVDERFGSWVTQYGYANLITQAKLIELATARDGGVDLAGRRFTTLVAGFEPFPQPALLDLMRLLVEGGGRVVWLGSPPLLTAEGGDALGPWQDLFGCRYAHGQEMGRMAPGMRVVFEGALEGVAPQTILTGLLVDRIYPVVPHDSAGVVARVKGEVVGVSRASRFGGSATFLGYRPRDDQSRSLGDDARNLFEGLDALGAYPPTGRFAGHNDNTEYLSRTGAYLCCRFPNGTVTIAPHLREVEESWPGGFARDEEEDRAILHTLTLPSRRVTLRDFRVNGHTVTYDGVGAVAFRVNDRGALVAFTGSGANSITVDGRETVFVEPDGPPNGDAHGDGDGGEIVWAPVPPERRVAGGAVLQINCGAAGRYHLPATTLQGDLWLVVEGPSPGSRGAPIPAQRDGDMLTFTVTPDVAGRWIYGVPGQGDSPGR